MDGVSNERRRIPRLPLECPVEIRDRFTICIARTEDVGSRGCRIAMKRAIAVGTLLRLRFAPGDGADPVELLGQAVWVRTAPRIEAGVAFTGTVSASDPRPEAWLDQLVASELRRAVREGRGLGALGDVKLQLGIPPPSATLGAPEVAVLRLVRALHPVSAIAVLHGVEALSSLLSRGIVTLSRVRPDVKGWSRALATSADRPTDRDAPKPSAGVIVLPPPTTAAAERASSIQMAIEAHLRGVD